MKFKFVKKAFCTLLAATVFVTAFTTNPFFVSAATNSELKDEIQDIEDELAKLKKQKSSEQEYINVLQSKIDLVNVDVENLEKQISDLQAKIVDIESKIADTQNQIKDIKAKIADNQAKFDKKQEEYNQRLRAMYISGSVTNIEVLMTSTDMSELLTRMEMVSSISKQDSEALTQLMKAMEEIKKQQEDLESKKNDLNNSKKDLEASKSQINANLDKVKEQKAQLDSDKSERNSKMAKLAADIQGKEKVQEELEQELAEQDGSFSSGDETYGGAVQPGTGRFTHPCPGYKYISATFPRYASGAKHTGVDFSAATGTSVLAADSGTVITVKDLGGKSYGKHVMIAHGNGTYTLYAHMSGFNVRAGQNVSKGQKIGSVGSTGNSTGSHLHFEVRKGGSSISNCVNPLAYL